MVEVLHPGVQQRPHAALRAQSLRVGGDHAHRDLPIRDQLPSGGRSPKRTVPYLEQKSTKLSVFDQMRSCNAGGVPFTR